MIRDYLALLSRVLLHAQFSCVSPLATDQVFDFNVHYISLQIKGKFSHLFFLPGAQTALEPSCEWTLRGKV